MATRKKAQDADVQNAKPAKVRLTAAQRRELQAQERQRKEQEWEEYRRMHWLDMWSTALRLQLLFIQDEEFKNGSSWFSATFHVDAAAQTVTMDDSCRTGAVSFDTLTMDSFEQNLRTLHSMFDTYEELCAERERKKAEEVARKEAVARARAKLTEEDLKALGLR